MKLVIKSKEAIGTLEADDLIDSRKAALPALQQNYLYGASASNIEFPEGDLIRISLKAKGHYSGIGVETDAFDETTLLTGRRFKAQHRIVHDYLDALNEAVGNFQITKVVVLFSPVKIFVQYENGIEGEEVLYTSVNGRSNGSGLSKIHNWPEGTSNVPLERKIEWARTRITQRKYHQKENHKRLAVYEGEGNEGMVNFYKDHIDKTEKEMVEDADHMQKLLEEAGIPA